MGGRAPRSPGTHWAGSRVVPGCRRGKLATRTSGAGHSPGHTQEGISHVLLITEVADTGTEKSTGPRATGERDRRVSAERRPPPPRAARAGALRATRPRLLVSMETRLTSNIGKASVYPLGALRIS